MNKTRVVSALLPDKKKIKHIYINATLFIPFRFVKIKISKNGVHILQIIDKDFCEKKFSAKLPVILNPISE